VARRYRRAHGNSGAVLDIGDPIYLCDTWKGVVKAGSADPYYRGTEHADTSEQVVRRLLEPLRLGGVHLLKGVFPDDTAGKIEAEAFRLCHIDVGRVRVGAGHVRMGLAGGCRQGASSCSTTTAGPRPWA
jgi:hypothetical protein